MVTIYALDPQFYGGVGKSVGKGDNRVGHQCLLSIVHRSASLKHLVVHGVLIQSSYF